MKSLEESVVTSMDGEDTKLFEFLPYILQDLWEIGASPEVVIKLIQKHRDNHSSLKILDLGCGKGAVSVKLAKKLGCFCLGIDAIEDFIHEAKIKAKEYGVEKNCQFEMGDIRERVKGLKDYDVIILGAIGPVLGDYYSTLTTLSGCLNQHGVVIIDDGYIQDDSSFAHPFIEKKSTLLKQIKSSRMQLVDEVLGNVDEIKESDDFIFERLKNRCYELIEKYPDKKELFENYIKKQEQENDVLETKVVCSTMLLQKES